MFCTKCGTENPDEARFCGACGSEMPVIPIASPVSTPEVVETTAEAAVPMPTPTASAAPAAPAPAAPAAPAMATPPAPAAPAMVAPAVPAAAPVAAPVPAMSAVPGVPTQLQPKRTNRVIIRLVAAVAVLAVAVFAIYSLFFAPYNIDDKTFPDYSLRHAVLTQFDYDGDGKLTRDEAKRVTVLDLSGSGIASLEGLQLFENLQKLNLSGTSALIQADFSKIKNVIDLDLSNSALISADVGALTNLQSLHARGAHFADIDLSKNTRLANLVLNDNVYVTGLEATNLREQYLLSQVEGEGYAGAYDGQGGGGGVDKYAYEFTYDDAGNLTSRNTRNESTYNGKTDTYNYGARFTYQNGKLATASTTGSSSTDVTYNYDEKGNMTSARSTYHGSSSNSVTNYTLRYDANNVLTEADVSYSSSSQHGVFKYNDAGQYLGKTVSYSGNTNDQSSSIVYDNAGRISSISTPWMAMEFSYNDSGQLTTKKTYWINNGVKSSTPTVIAFSYDDAGRVVSATREYKYDTSSTKITSSVEYDTHGNVARVTKRSESTYEGAKPLTGTQTFSYTRVFTAKSAPDLEQPLLIGDPSHVVTTNWPWHPDLRLGNQSEIAVAGMRVLDGFSIMV